MGKFDLLTYLTKNKSVNISEKLIHLSLAIGQAGCFCARSGTTTTKNRQTTMSPLDKTLVINIFYTGCLFYIIQNVDFCTFLQMSFFVYKFTALAYIDMQYLHKLFSAG